MAGQGYIGRSPGDSSVVVARQTYTPTGITTNFTFASSYTVGYIDTYLNGVRLVEGNDFTATDGSVVGLTTHAQNGDVLELVAYKAFNVGNVTNALNDFSVAGNLSVTGVSTFTGAITATGGITGALTGDATGLSGTPDIAIRNLTGVAATFTGVVSYEDVTNVDSVGYATFRSGINVQGAGSTTTTLNVSGVSTFTGNIDANGNVDIDGHTELDDLNVSGVSTFASLVDINDYVTISSGLDVAGAGSTTTTLNVTGVGTFGNGLIVQGTGTTSTTLNVSGVSTLSNVVVGGATTEMVITGDLRVTGIITTGTGTVTIDGTNNRIGIGTASPRTTLDLAEETGGIALPQGTVAQRPTGDNPYLRWNTTNSALEFYNGTDWVEIISDYFPSGSTILG
jgi:hypothetical protein